MDPHSKPPRTVVIIDDNVDLTSTIRMFLARHGHAVYAAETARDALVLLEHVLPDVIFSDVDLPDRDGFELAAMIKSRPDLETTPVLAVTARCDLSRPSSAVFDRILFKPVPLATMLDLVENFRPFPRSPKLDV